MKLLTDTMHVDVSENADWKDLARQLPSPLRQIIGKRSSPTPLADNIVCFSRRSAADLNHPQRGRALHHRYVLILALETTVTVCVDDQEVPLHPGEGLLVLPFQFHDYVRPEKEQLLWMFVTFDIADTSALNSMRFRPFVLDDTLRQLVCELTRSYLLPDQDDVTVALFRLLLERIKRATQIERSELESRAAPTSLLVHINHLAQTKGCSPTIKEIASAVGISESHLRARFRTSCGVSLGKHLRRLQMEKACGLLRLSTNRVSDISELCGFSSVYSFSRAFSTAYGLSPRAYRQAGVPAVKKPALTSVS